MTNNVDTGHVIIQDRSSNDTQHDENSEKVRTVIKTVTMNKMT